MYVLKWKKKIHNRFIKEIADFQVERLTMNLFRTRWTNQPVFPSVRLEFRAILWVNLVESLWSKLKLLYLLSNVKQYTLKEVLVCLQSILATVPLTELESTSVKFFSYIRFQLYSLCLRHKYVLGPTESHLSPNCES